MIKGPRTSCCAGGGGGGGSGGDTAVVPLSLSLAVLQGGTLRTQHRLGVLPAWRNPAKITLLCTAQDTYIRVYVNPVRVLLGVGCSLYFVSSWSLLLLLL